MPSRPKATTFRYVTAEGLVETRTSHRTYTHVVVGRKNRVKERACETSVAIEQQYASNYDWFIRCTTTEVGKPFDAANAWHTNTVDLMEQAIATVAAFPTKEAYVVGKTSEAIDRIGAGDAGPECVLQWSMSERAANASISWHSQWHVGVRIVPLGATDSITSGICGRESAAADKSAAAPA